MRNQMYGVADREIVDKELKLGSIYLDILRYKASTFGQICVFLQFFLLWFDGMLDGLHNNFNGQWTTLA